MIEISFLFFSIIVSGILSLFAYELNYFKESGFYAFLIFGSIILFSLGLKGFLPILFLFLLKFLLIDEKEDFTGIFSNLILPSIFSILWYFKRNEIYFYLFLISISVFVSIIFGKKLKLLGYLIGAIIFSFFSLNLKFSIYLIIFSFTGGIINSLIKKFLKEKYSNLISSFISSSIFLFFVLFN
jgi:uncharacterized membrane protein